MEGFTWLYIVWSIVPIAIAVLFSFNKGASQATWQGFSTKWYVGSGVNSVLHNPSLHQAVIQTLVLAGLTTVICVPIGVGFAIGIDRWRTPDLERTEPRDDLLVRDPGAAAGGGAVPAGHAGADVHRPRNRGRGGRAGRMEHQLAGDHRAGAAGEHRAELRGGGLTDLGASRLGAIRRVLLPLLMPAIFASAVLVFASTVDDFVIVEQLSSTAATQPMSVLIYANVHGGLSGPALNALATIMLLFTLVAVLIGFFAYRWMTRGERTKGTAEALTSIAGI